MISEQKLNNMNRKTATILIIAIVLLFIGYIIFDLVFVREGPEVPVKRVAGTGSADPWRISGIIDPAAGRVKAVAVDKQGDLVIGGENFLVCYNEARKLLWKKITNGPVSAIAIAEDTIYVTMDETVVVYNLDGEKLNEWGPFEDNSIITSIAANHSFIVVADAGNKIILVLDRKGNLKNMIGKSGEPFIVPSPYFDVAIDRFNNIYVANTGRRQIEKRDPEGRLISSFGEAGTAPEAFCGCCNPAHFALVPQGFITAEKGINRIKLLDRTGKFIEYVSSINQFNPPVPLDVTSADGSTIYGANPADSKVYVFVRK